MGSDLLAAIDYKSLEYLGTGLVGLGFLIFFVVKGMQKAGLFNGQKQKENLDPAPTGNPGILGSVKNRHDYCVTESELWQEHLHRYKQSHDELCESKLKPLYKGMERIEKNMECVQEIKGTVETILKIQKKNGK